MNKIKKYKLNYNAPYYDARTGGYVTRDGRVMGFAEASKDKWKCEKCSETFPTFKMLMKHKNQVHSYGVICHCDLTNLLHSSPASP